MIHRTGHDAPDAMRTHTIGVILLLTTIWAAAAGVSLAGLRAAPVTQVPLRINPNTADPAALALLPGVGPARARAIAEFRAQQAGPAFKDADDLQRVRGIGPKTAAAIARFLRFGPTDRRQDGSRP